MKQPGQIVLTPFPYTDLSTTKLRPVLQGTLLAGHIGTIDASRLSRIRERLSHWISAEN